MTLANTIPVNQSMCQPDILLTGDLKNLIQGAVWSLAPRKPSMHCGVAVVPAGSSDVGHSKMPDLHSGGQGSPGGQGTTAGQPQKGAQMAPPACLRTVALTSPFPALLPLPALQVPSYGLP